MSWQFTVGLRVLRTRPLLRIVLLPHKIGPRRCPSLCTRRRSQAFLQMLNNLSAVLDEPGAYAGNRKDPIRKSCSITGLPLICFHSSPNPDCSRSRQGRRCAARGCGSAET